MRKFVRTLLLAMGVTDVHDAPGGASGLVASGVIDPDVVILDWQMDGVNGPACMGRGARNEFSHPNVPIIVLTGHREQARMVEAIGCDEFLCPARRRKGAWPRCCSSRG